MAGEVKGLLDALHDGSMTLDEVAHRFRDRRWPRRDASPPSSYREAAIAELQDPEPFPTDSYEDVAEAHHRGRLTDAQYEVLVRAIADSQRAEDERCHDHGEFPALFDDNSPGS